MTKVPTKAFAAKINELSETPNGRRALKAALSDLGTSIDELMFSIEANTTEA